MKISDEKYARDLLAQKWGQDVLVAKAERLLGLLREQLKRLAPTATVRRVELSTLRDTFDIEVVTGRGPIPLRIREEVVDDLFERGSSEAEARIAKILEVAVKYQNSTTQ